MTALSILSPTALPAHLRDRGASSLGRTLSGGGEQGKRISVKGGVFRLYNDGKEVASIEDRYLDVVIINAHPKISRAFYAGTYVEGATVAPVCSSANGDVPDASVKTPQSKSCATCPKNMKGSGQGDSRACRFNQNLAVVLANDIEAGDVMKLTLASTSIFGDADGDNMPLQAYIRAIMAVPGGGPERLVTRLKFDTKAPVPKLFFKPMRWLEKHEQDAVDEKATSPDALRAIAPVAAGNGGETAPAVAAPAALGAPSKAAPLPPEDDDEPPAPPPKTAKATKSKPAPAPVEDVEDAEPVVRTAAAAPANAVPSNKLSSALSEWDDE